MEGDHRGGAHIAGRPRLRQDGGVDREWPTPLYSTLLIPTMPRSRCVWTLQ